MMRLQKIIEDVVEMADNFNLCIDDDAIGKPLEVVPVELSNEEFLEIERNA